MPFPYKDHVEVIQVAFWRHFEIHLLFATEAVYPVMGVSDEYWDEVLR
jgi:hypothetical protein